MPLTVIVNRAGGAAAAAGPGLEQQLQDAFAKAGAAPRLRLLDPDSIPAAVEEAAADGRLVVAGGDGTIASAAQTLKGRDAELALLPLGTLNHFARALGIPADIEAAAALAATGTAQRVDVGEVNGHRFINNASIGLYPFMVSRREAVQHHRHWPKWLATGPAAWAALRRLPHHRLRIDMGHGSRAVVTPMLFVGNNRYTLDAGNVGGRDRLTDGVLSVFAVAHRSRIGLIWFALRSLFGRADRQADFVTIGECDSITVHTASHSIEIALDGEVRRLSTPLRFRAVPGALRVVVPPAEPEVSG